MTGLNFSREPMKNKELPFLPISPCLYTNRFLNSVFVGVRIACKHTLGVTWQVHTVISYPVPFELSIPAFRQGKHEHGHALRRSHPVTASSPPRGRAMPMLPRILRPRDAEAPTCSPIPATFHSSIRCEWRKKRKNKNAGERAARNPARRFA